MNLLRATLLEILEQTTPNIVIDLTGVKFMSYMGVGALVERLRLARSMGGDIALVGVNLYLERLFRMVGIVNVFTVFSSVDEALQYFNPAADKAAG